MTIVVNMHQAKTQLSKLVEKACRGEEVILANNGTPVAKIVPATMKAQRTLGAYVGKMKVPENFNNPLPKDIEDAFYDSKILPE